MCVLPLVPWLNAERAFSAPHVNRFLHLRYSSFAILPDLPLRPSLSLRRFLSVKHLYPTSLSLSLSQPFPPPLISFLVIRVMARAVRGNREASQHKAHTTVLDCRRAAVLSPRWVRPRESSLKRQNPPLCWPTLFSLSLYLSRFFFLHG